MSFFVIFRITFWTPHTSGYLRVNLIRASKFFYFKYAKKFLGLSRGSL